MSYVEFKNVSKTYKTGDVKVEALKDASFEIGKGEICVIVGQSGAVRPPCSISLAVWIA